MGKSRLHLQKILVEQNLEPAGKEPSSEAQIPTVTGLYWFNVNTLALILVLLAPPPQDVLQDAALAGVRPILQRLRAQVTDYSPTRGATSELTVAKHLLRDWIESQLGELPEDGDIRAFQLELNAALADAELFCTEFYIECGDNILGYVDGIRMSREREFLVVVTAPGVWCGYDESAYVYAWEGPGWQRIWENEQTRYTEEGYLPQTIHDVQLSSLDANGDRLLMTLGSQAACAGSFKDLYTRVWQLDANNQSTTVLDWTEYANDGGPPINGQVPPDDVLVQFNAGGIVGGSPHWAVRHFQVLDGTATQIDPIAVRPQDFVIEWIAAPWQQSQMRSESPRLEEWHAQLHREDGVGDFPDPTLQCTEGSDLWQVGTYFYDGPKRYYRVRWQRPYSFTLVGVSEAPYPDCTIADPQGDAYPQLFDSDPD